MLRHLCFPLYRGTWSLLESKVLASSLCHACNIGIWLHSMIGDTNFKGDSELETYETHASSMGRSSEAPKKPSITLIKRVWSSIPFLEHLLLLA